MMRDDLELERLRALVAAEPPPTACPPSDLLARVVVGEASDDEREQVADHLTMCATCSDEFRVASSLGVWARRAAVDLDDGTHRREDRYLSRRWAIAASALLAAGIVAALALWAQSLRNENVRLSAQLQERATPVAAPESDAALQDDRAVEIAGLQARLNEALTPALNVPIVDLLPRDGVRGSASGALPRIPAGAHAATFVITTASNPASRDHGLEIVGPLGDVLWRGSGLRPNAERTFTVTVPRAFLPAGTCRLRLFTEQNGSRTSIAEYAVRVEP